MFPVLSCDPRDDGFAFCILKGAGVLGLLLEGGGGEQQVTLFFLPF